MTEKLILETTTKYRGKRLRKDTYDNFVASASHSYGVYMSMWWMITTFILGSLFFFMRGWLYFWTGFYLSDVEFMGFWVVWGMGTTTLAYKAFFHHYKVQLIPEWLDHLNSPTETIEREVIGDTSIMEIDSTGVNANSMFVMNGQPTARTEQPRQIGDLTIDGRILHALKKRRLDGESGINRDVWRGFVRAGIFSSGKEADDHYNLVKRTMVANGWWANNQWTDLGDDWLLPPPHED